MVSHDALGIARLYTASHKLDNGRTIWPTVDQVAQEDQVPPIWMNTVLSITEMRQYIAERVYLTVDIAYNVERIGSQGLYQAGHPSAPNSLGWAGAEGP
jgi:hypothetical protein